MTRLGIDGIEAIQGSRINDSILNSGCAIESVIGMDLPEYFSGVDVEGGQCLIERTDINNAILDDWRGGNSAASAVGPCHSERTAMSSRG